MVVPLAGTIQQFQRQADVFLGAQMRQKVELLKNNADMGGTKPGQPGLVHGGQVSAVHRDPAPVRTVKARQQGNERRFAAAGLAGDGQGGAGRQGKMGTAQDGQVARFRQGIGLVQIVAPQPAGLCSRAVMIDLLLLGRAWSRDVL